MDTPQKVNRREVTVENTNICVTCQCISKVKYAIIDNKGTRGAACAIVETFYDAKFASCQTNYGTYIYVKRVERFLIDMMVYSTL